MAEYLFDLRLSCYVSDLKFEPYYVGPLKLSKRSFPSSKICFFRLEQEQQQQRRQQQQRQIINIKS